MAYDDPQALPSRFSYDVDLLGYYNGQPNLNLVPKGQHIILDGVFADLALRTSNFGYAKKGSLKTIYNPTGGRTEFEYEEPKVRTLVNKLEELHVVRNNAPYIDALEDTFDIGGTEIVLGSQEPTLTIQKDQTMVVRVFANILNNAGHNPAGGVTVIVEDWTVPTAMTSQTGSIPFTGNIVSYDESLSFSLVENHKYLIKLQLAGTSSTISAQAYAQCIFQAYEFFPAQGMRIKRVKDYADGEIARTTTYHYKKAEHVGTYQDDSAVVLYDGDAKSRTDNGLCELLEQEPESYSVAGVLNNPFASTMLTSDNQAEYRYVTLSFGGDNFEEGGIEKRFRIEKKEKTEIIYRYSGTSEDTAEEIQAAEDRAREQFEYDSMNLNNADGFNGALIGQRIIERRGTALYVNSETDYEFEISTDHEQKCLMISLGSDNGTLSEYPNRSTPTGTFSYKSYRFRLASTTTRAYPDPYPLSNPAQATNPITSLTKYTYGTLRGMPASIISKNSNGKNRIQKSYFPVTADISAMTGLASQDIANYELMEDQNIVSVPIQTETYLQEDDNATPVLLSRARNYFTQITSTPANIVMPLSKKSAKGSEALIGFGSISQYDSSGRPVQITEPNGLVKSIVYGYGGSTVIAELSNMSYNSISLTLIASLQADSKNITDATSLAAFEAQLNTLRTDPAYANAMVMTYVYGKDGRPLSATDQRGYKTSRQYDECGRVKFMLDNDGNVIEETNYHNKTNN